MKIISIKIVVVGLLALTLIACGGGGGETTSNNPPGISDQTGFSLGNNTTVLRNASNFTRTASNSQVNDVLYTSSDSSVATIDMNNGLISIQKVGTTTIQASSSGNSQYNSASATFVLSVNQTMLQEWLGGKYLDESQETTSVAFNTGTG
jgi:hypothetical protein